LERPLPKSSSETFTSASRGVPQGVAALVLLAALDERRRTEVLDDRFAQRLAPIDDPRPARAAHPAHID